MKFAYAVFVFLCPIAGFSQKFTIHSTIITKSNDSLQVLTAEKQLSPSKSIRVLDAASGQYHCYPASELNGIIIGNDDYYIY